jgi:hypothetical protein
MVLDGGDLAGALTGSYLGTFELTAMNSAVFLLTGTSVPVNTSVSIHRPVPVLTDFLLAVTASCRTAVSLWRPYSHKTEFPWASCFQTAARERVYSL